MKTVQELIELAKQYNIDGDGTEYEVLYEASEKSFAVPGLVCEIGLRRGFGTFLMMNVVGNHKHYIAVDPFGDIPYKDGGGEMIWDYSNLMKAQTMQSIYKWCEDNSFDLYFYPLEDTEFFARFADGVPVYDTSKGIETEYSLVHIDGPHTMELVMNETKFFVSRMAKGGYIVYDDIVQYDHGPIDSYLLSNGFVRDIVGRTHKVGYKKHENIIHSSRL